jgi:competence protein ComEA
MRAWLAARARVALIGVVAFIVGFAVRGPVEPLLGPQRAPAAATPAGLALVEPTSLPTRPAMLLVHVSGAVRQPGVYTLEEGQRIQDAVAAAGGATDDAEIHSLNLAAPLKDGQHVIVPAVAPTAGPRLAGPTPAPRPLNLNTASAAELEALPGIGPVTAARIVKYREDAGGFRSVDELRTAKLVNEATFNRLRDLVTVQ